MTSGARCLLSFLVRHGRRTSGKSWWGQQRMADDLGVSRASIIRWVAELVRLGLIDSTRRGSTSNMYRVLACGKLRSCATSDVANCNNVGAPVLLTEPSTSEPKASPAAPVENCERKPPIPERETNSPAVLFRGSSDMVLRPDIAALLGQPSIRHESGAVIRNEAFFRARDALFRARERIWTARSPEAYVRAIIWREARAG